VGVKEDSFEIISWEIFKYCVSVIIKDRKLRIYGDSFPFMVPLMKNTNLILSMSSTM
jgi:hypothetical protein